MNRRWAPRLGVLSLAGSVLVGCEEALIRVDGPAVEIVPSLRAEPEALDLGTLFVGESTNDDFSVTNESDGPLDLTIAVTGGWMMAYTLDRYSVELQAGESATWTLTLSPTSWGDHSVSVVAETGDLRVELPVSAWVELDADGDGYGSEESRGEDCDDSDATIHPGAEDAWYDGIDHDCAGNADDDQDADGAPVDRDCDDTDAARFPGNADPWYDGVDSNCSGNDDFDQDADGWVPPAYSGLATGGVDGSGQLPGGDCDDTDASAFPGATEEWYDAVDSDCAGDDDFDQDADGHRVDADCNDTDPSVYPGAPETWYDGVDQDCDGGADDDQDGDGLALGDDCDDTDAAVGAAISEVLDGADNDCNGLLDDLSIESVATGVLHGIYDSLHLGDRGLIATASDLTGDGEPDLVLGGPNYSYGSTWVISGSVAATARGDVDDFDVAMLSGTSAYWPVGYVNGHPADIDGDGAPDLAVGAAYSTGYYGYARGYVWLGGTALSGNLDADDADATFDATDASDYERMVATGDLDGDGLAEVILGAGMADDDSGRWSGDSDAGAVIVFDAAALSGENSASDEEEERSDAADIVYGTDGYDYLGWSLVSADLDGDGYADILAGAPGFDGSASSGGGVFLLLGNSALNWSGEVDSAASSYIQGDIASLALGADSLAYPGDVDGDGALDLGLSSEDSGRAFLFLGAGSFSGAVASSDATADWTGTAGDLGSTMLLDSDLDGDGLDDLLIGADGDDTAGSNAGIAYLFTGGSWTGAVDPASASATLYGQTSDAYFGCGSAGGFDLDGDGREDAVIGEWGADDAATDGGAAWFLPGW